MERRDQVFTAILAAVPQELSGLPAQLNNAESFEFLGENFHRGTLGNNLLLIGTTGLGKVNAAIITAALLERFAIGQVWNIGCAGAYREGPVRVGDVIISERILFGDEGVLQSQQVLSSREIGIPLLKMGSEELYDGIPLHRQDLFQWIRRTTPAGCYRPSADSPAEHLEQPAEPASALPAESPEQLFRLHFGTSLTVGMASGDVATASQRFQRYGAAAENMEGSAVAQTCFRFAVPMLECRGISNTAGDRCKANWRLSEALAHCHEIVMNWLLELTATQR